MSGYEGDDDLRLDRADRLLEQKADLIGALKAIRMLADESGDHQISLIAKNAISKAQWSPA